MTLKDLRIKIKYDTNLYSVNMTNSLGDNQNKTLEDFSVSVQPLELTASRCFTPLRKREEKDREPDARMLTIQEGC